MNESRDLYSILQVADSSAATGLCTFIEIHSQEYAHSSRNSQESREPETRIFTHIYLNTRVAPDCEIRKAYRALALSLHPDKNGGRKNPGWDEVHAAYEVVRMRACVRRASTYLQAYLLLACLLG